MHPKSSPQNIFDLVINPSASASTRNLTELSFVKSEIPGNKKLKNHRTCFFL